MWRPRYAVGRELTLALCMFIASQANAKKPSPPRGQTEELTPAGLALSAAMADASRWPEAPAFVHEPIGVGPALALDQVLSSVDRVAPKLLAQRAKLDQARAKVTSFAGAFDPKLDLKARARPRGYYDGGMLSSRLTQPLGVLGSKAFAGYRRSWGNIPVYEEFDRTLNDGELFAGLQLSPLQAWFTDPQRLGLATSRLGVAMREAQLEVTRLALRRKAAERYYKWVLAGAKLAIKQELVTLAQERERQLQALVSAGALAELSLLDNRRSVIRRQSKAWQSVRELRGAAVALSQYWIGEAGKPVVPSAQQLPLPMAAPSRQMTLAARASLDEAMRRRPEPHVLKSARRELELRLSQKRSERLPQLVVSGEIARDLGNARSDFRSSLGPTEVKVKADLKFPLLQRKARGDIAALRAQLQQVDAELTGVRNALLLERNQLLNEHTWSVRELKIATANVQAARLVADAERVKLQEGASSLVIVNLREQAVAEAEEERAEALATTHLVQALWRWSGFQSRR